MKKILCVEGVRDKYTKVQYEANKEYEFTDTRAQELLNTKYFKEVKVNEEVKKEDKPKTKKK